MINEARPAETVHPLHGEWDLANAHELAVRLRRLCDVSPGDVVLDCSALRFWDSSAVVVLVEVQQRLRGERRGFRLVNLHGMPRRVLEILGLAELLCGDDPSSVPTP